MSSKVQTNILTASRLFSISSHNLIVSKLHKSIILLFRNKGEKKGEQKGHFAVTTLHTSKNLKWAGYMSGFLQQAGQVTCFCRQKAPGPV